jgi:hypothetical protein
VCLFVKSSFVSVAFKSWFFSRQQTLTVHGNKKDAERELRAVLTVLKAVPISSPQS